MHDNMRLTKSKQISLPVRISYFCHCTWLWDWLATLHFSKWTAIPFTLCSSFYHPFPLCQSVVA